MASSRKSQPSPKLGKRIAVALSGGLDSVVLLDTVCKSALANKNPPEIWAFHIHHGLQKAADEWFVFCEKLAKKYQIQFDFRLLHLGDDAKQGNVEARARTARYEALAELCADHGVQDLLLAHHQNDQAETVLLQLLRGSGVAGLAGMAQARELKHGDIAITLWRPLIAQSKVELEAYAKTNKLKWVEDPSNQNIQYRRNAIRKDIIPRLEKIQPDAIANLARSANILGQSQALLDRLAKQDGKLIIDKSGLKVALLMTLAENDLPAANNVVRYWLKTHDLAMPSQERLAAWWKDLASAKRKRDAQLEWLHDERKIRLWRDLLQVADEQAGEWVFKKVNTKSKEPGLPVQWVEEALNNGLIEVRSRVGAEKIQIKPNSPRKSLKNLFQEGDIPPWQRQAPLLFIKQELVAVAGVGVSYPQLVHSGPRVLPEWRQAGFEV
ncbi:tRNA lysidine(34) synthetase TilS [Polynucleobacter sp. 15G-AUS-farblos]|uniref:tRNA lysidine(34) synthetase TilS n=1 Tax=Polynucleobacter sp. 15G-AUS-farblos TaxID=2689094 RepID=UPI001C0DAD03|nr:tRNA lysidine(34) synthetase TilS [Polynucleobacter sp. 15G-AUS-farblos]MBU3584348.1 tRNA lysidine(34) synthetase TilS [Polynucleobacter sp. 15G-AUS-farblos]